MVSRVCGLQCLDLTQRVVQKVGFTGPGRAGASVCLGLAHSVDDHTDNALTYVDAWSHTTTGKYELEVCAIAVAYLDAHASVKVPIVVDVPQQ